MASRAHHARLITMTPLGAAVLILPPPRAGEKHGLDFEVLLRPGLRHGIILRRRDGSLSATPGAFSVLFGHAHISVSKRARRCASRLYALRWSRLRPPVVRRDACLDGRVTGGFGHVSAVCSSYVDCGCVVDVPQVLVHHIPCFTLIRSGLGRRYGGQF